MNSLDYWASPYQDGVINMDGDFYVELPDGRRAVFRFQEWHPRGLHSNLLWQRFSSKAQDVVITWLLVAKRRSVNRDVALDVAALIVANMDSPPYRRRAMASVAADMLMAPFTDMPASTMRQMLGSFLGTFFGALLGFASSMLIKQGVQEFKDFRAVGSVYMLMGGICAIAAAILMIGTE